MPRPNRRNEILDAAIKVFAERGFVGVSTRDIAKKAGVSSPSIYVHFATFEDLTTEALRRVDRERALDYKKVLDHECTDFVKMKSLAHLVFSGYRKSPTLVQVYQNALLHKNPRAMNLMAKEFYGDIYPGILQAISKVSKVGNPAFVYFTIVSLSVGYVLCTPIHRKLGKIEAKEITPDHLTNCVLNTAIPGVPWEDVEPLDFVKRPSRRK